MNRHMADVVKLVNTPDCGSGISWVRAPSFAPVRLKSLLEITGFLLVHFNITVNIKTF